jgi:hypothetical protein
MNRESVKPFLTSALTTVALAFCLLQSTVAQSPKSGNVQVTIVPNHFFGTTNIAPYGGGSLSRNNDGVFGTIYASGLTPGTVVTMWWAIFNNPEFCAAETCAPSDFLNPLVDGALLYGGGRLIGVDAYATFGGYRAEGDNTGFQINPGYPNPSPGLIDSKKAQIHLALRTHGMASSDPAVLQQQLTSFNGGCPPNSCMNVQAAIFK